MSFAISVCGSAFLRCTNRRCPEIESAAGVRWAHEADVQERESQSLTPTPERVQFLGQWYNSRALEKFHLVIVQLEGNSRGRRDAGGGKREKNE